ncbi:MAG: hypothetical protein IJD37_03215 [Clostridia bacterium]|nr:hypothetical protein [Clostridia bacterium]
MTKRNGTKRALLSSVVALFLCFSMLLGTTFAWFTDTVTSAGNVIQSGTLDVDLVDADGNSLAGEVIEFIAADNRAQDKILWEPGCTYETEPVRVVNNGNLALKYQIVINGIEGNAKLLDAIEWTVTITDANGAENKVALSELQGKLLAGEETGSIVLSGHMKEEAGNEYQGLKVEGVSITVYATQLTYEEDSFDDQYDADAPFSIWNGVVPAEMPASLVVDGATQTIHVKDADAFVYLSKLSADWAALYSDGQGTTYTNYANGAGADYYYSGKWTISLEADIDLNNIAIEPIEIMIGQSTGATAFNGNNHVIRNINASTGLFANFTRATFANLVLMNVTATNGALAGSVSHGVNNVTVENATISGDDYVGGLVGKTYSSIVRCKVIDSSVVATGKEAGGLVGYAETSSESNVSNNVVNNVTVYAGNRAAGLIAQANVNVKVYGNTIDTVTVGATDMTKYQPGAVVSNALDATNIYDNTVNNTTVYPNTVAIVENDTDIRDALKAGNNVVLTDDIITTDAESNGYGSTGFNVNGGVLDGNGKTVEVEGASSTWDSAIAIKGGTIKNITVAKGFRGIFIKNGTEKVVLENVIIDGPTYTVSCDSAGKQGLEAYNSTFNGWTSYAATIGTAKFVDCSFGEGAGYAYCRPYAPTEFVGCDFSEGYAIDARAVVTFENCTINGQPLTAENLSTLVIGNIGNATIK